VLALEPDQVDHLGDDLADETPVLADDLESERDVLVDVLVRQEPEVLEDAADPPPQVRHLPVAQSREVPAGHVDPAIRGPLLLQDQP
jgi:hypothetical protein